MPKLLFCVYCGCAAEGNYSIHEHGFCDGEEVPLCDECGSGGIPFVRGHLAAHSE